MRSRIEWLEAKKQQGSGQSKLRTSGDPVGFQEKGQEYLARAENMATTLGLTVGERQIGVRLGQQDKPLSYGRTWQVSGAPKEWQKCSSWKRLYKKDTTNWVVRAIVDDRDFIEIQAGEHLIFVTPATEQ